VVKSASLPKKHVLTVVKIDLGEVKGQNRDEFLFHVGTITQAKAKVDAVKKTLKAARRAAQDSGYHLADMDEAMFMREQEPETVQATIMRKAQYANWMGTAPEIKQGDLFMSADKSSDSDKWFQEGREEALLGLPAKGERYDAGSEAGEARLHGWNEGHARRERLKQEQIDAFKAAEKTEAEKKAAKAKSKSAKEMADA
jgi:hypothetical protein